MPTNTPPDIPCQQSPLQQGCLGEHTREQEMDCFSFQQFVAAPASCAEDIKQLCIPGKYVMMNKSKLPVQRFCSRNEDVPELYHAQRK
jgi:hypothetical protein